jgi:hypothetical protein
MRPLLRTLALMTLLVLPATAAAQTLAARDLVALTKAGLSDDVLIAMIEADNAVFWLGYAQVLELRKQGLSERVLIKMIESRTPRSTPQAPQVLTVNQGAAPTEPTPVVVTQTVTQKVYVEAPEPQREYVQVPVYVPVAVREPRERVREPEPVYWGFNGQRRPDTWQEPAKKGPPARPGGR